MITVCTVLCRSTTDHPNTHVSNSKRNFLLRHSRAHAHPECRSCIGALYVYLSAH